MKYDTMLEQCMQMYPKIYPTRDEFLHHVFFVNGNGLEWVNGEICDVFEYDEPFEVRLAKHQQDRADHRAQWEAEVQQDLAAFRKTNERLGERGLLAYPNDFIREWEESHQYDKVFRPNRCTKLYPMCEFATILGIPSDCAEDWLAAAEQALALSKRLRKTKEDARWLAIARKKVKEIRAERRRYAKQNT